MTVPCINITGALYSKLLSTKCRQAMAGLGRATTYF